MIKIILLTGFLGSGKTTLLQRLLRHFEAAPIGLIVNEFGEINIDARLLEKDGLIMSELSNGSIFCACIKDNFIKALIEMSSQDIRYLFIEASGLADPSNMQQILQSIDSQLSNPCHYSGSICVLDAEAFLELSDLLPAVGNQITYAGSIVVNKEDLITPEIKLKIDTAIRALNPDAPICFTRYCNVDIDTLIQHLKLSEAESANSTNTPQSRPQTIVLKILPSVTMDELRGFLDFIAPFTYRIKGFSKVHDVNYSVSGVRSHIMVIPWPGIVKSNEIVLISAVGIGLIGAIADGIRMFAPHSIRL